jgi:hypothetical protein
MTLFLGVPFSKAIMLILARESIFQISGKKLWAIWRIQISIICRAVFGWHKEKLQYPRLQKILNVYYTAKILAGTCKAIQFILLQQAVFNYLTFALCPVVACCFCGIWFLF